MTDEAPRGRNVFVAGPSSAAVVAALFAAAFDLPPARALTEDSPFNMLLDGAIADKVEEGVDGCQHRRRLDARSADGVRADEPNPNALQGSSSKKVFRSADSQACA